MIDAATGEPVRDGCVRVYDSLLPPGSYAVFATCTLAADGSYEVEVDPGRYWVRAEVDRYSDRYWGGSYGSHDARVLTVRSGSDRPGIDIDMERPAEIVGRVVDANTGRPVREACAAIRLGRTEHGTEDDGRSGWGCSRGGGRLVVRNLPPTAVTMVVRSPGSDYPQVWTWAYGTDDQQDATVFDLEPGGSTDVGDVPIEMLGTVRGKVTDARTGEPLAGMTVAIPGYGERSGECTYCATTNERGRYTLRTVQPGVYPASALQTRYPYDYAIQWLGGATDPAESRLVEVVDDQVVRANFRLERSATIVGTLPDPEEDWLALEAVLRGGDPERKWTVGFSSDVHPETGEFTIRGLPAADVDLCFNCYDDGGTSVPRVFWYDGVWDRADATAVTLRPGRTVRVEAALPPGW